jgi:hypothetical protein
MNLIGGFQMTRGQYTRKKATRKFLKILRALCYVTLALLIPMLEAILSLHEWLVIADLNLSVQTPRRNS